jgi:DNA-binding NarL/FixJ family response regulator
VTVPIRVLVADDEAIVCSGMAMLLAAEPDIDVVGQANSGAAALRAVEELRPDVLVLDVRMPDLDGAETTALLTARNADREHGSPKVLIVTTLADDATVYRALRAGARGFVLKFSAPTDLAAAVRRVAADQAWIDPTVGRAVIAAVSSLPGHGLSADAGVCRLTDREREVLCLMALGMDNSAIRGRLVLSEATVKTHVSRILSKTGCRDRAAAVAFAYRSGLVRP